MLETNQEYINITIKAMPGISENVEQISSNVKQTTEELKISVPVLLHEAERATNSAKGSIELAGVAMENVGTGINETIASYKKDVPNLIIYFNIFKEVFQILYRTFSPRK